MYKEFACYDQPLKSEVRKRVFRAIDLGVNGVSVPTIFISSLSDFMPEGIVLSAPIDWPNGRQETSVRVHAASVACNKGATTIDLVANMHLLLNDRLDDFIQDLGSVKTVCKEKGASLRVMLDYRMFHAGNEKALMTESCAVIAHMGIEYGFVSTGNLVDDCQENVILSHVMQKKHEISAIANGNIFLPKHMKMVDNANLFGARFHKIQALENCLVYNTVD
jgi:deoxyribose-phosphate aldolase